MKINEVEAQVGVTKKNIRFYEEQGLLSPRRNSDNGYRDYGEAEVEALRRIKLLRKLGVPISEIRRMQEGQQTVADAMRRHLVTLERERKDLDQAAALCARLKGEEVRLDDLDAGEILAEMERLEREGTAFQDKQRRDIPPVRYAGPVIAAVVMALLMAALTGFMFWSFAREPGVPLLLAAALAAVPVLVMLGVLLALYQRIGEIQKGEEDDAKRF